MKTLTDKQRKVLRFICEFINEHGYSPSREEIAKQCLRTNNVNAASQYTLALKFRGYIDYHHCVSRSLHVLIPDIGFCDLDKRIEKKLFDHGIKCGEDGIKWMLERNTLSPILNRKEQDEFVKWANRGIKYNI